MPTGWLWAASNYAVSRMGGRAAGVWRCRLWPPRGAGRPAGRGPGTAGTAV